MITNITSGNITVRARGREEPGRTARAREKRVIPNATKEYNRIIFPLPSGVGVFDCIESLLWFVFFIVTPKTFHITSSVYRCNE
jgi:hypothetical protein